MKSEATTVESYLVEVPDDRRAALTRLRQSCLEQLEGYQESMEYGMPSYKRPQGEVEVAFASQKNYISVYFLRQEVMEEHRQELEGLSLGKGCIRYTSPEKINFRVIDTMLQASRQAEGEIC